MDRWSGRVALVTGASSGIGAAIATALARNRMKVIGCGRQVDKIETLATQLSGEGCEGSLDAIHCDVRQETDIQAMFGQIRDKYGRLDVCINNAGLMKKSPLLSGSTADWREMMEVNVLALSVITREAVQYMKQNNIDDGQIINICSMSGHRLTRSADFAFYQASKYAVRALTEGVRAELRLDKSHIRIGEISPGLVETELFSRAGGQPFSDKLFKNLKALEAGDIADAVVYMLSAPAHVQVHDVLLRPTEQVT